jgi:hypothetical protein
LQRDAEDFNPSTQEANLSYRERPCLKNPKEEEEKQKEGR